jgi:integrase
MTNTIALSKTALKEIVLPIKGDNPIELRVASNPNLRVIFNIIMISLCVRICWKGQRHFKKIGTFPEMPLKTFERLANQFITDVQSGDFQRGSSLTLSEFVERDYLPDYNKRHRDLETVKSRWKKVKASLGSKRMDSITRRDIERFLNSLDCKPATVNRYKALLSAIFTRAVGLKVVSANPCSGIKALPENNVGTRVLSSIELTAFKRLALADHSQFHGNALVFALLTGLRIGNVISLKFNMLSDDYSYLVVPVTKSGKPQKVYLSSQAIAIVQWCSQFSTNQWLFQSPVNVKRHISYPRDCFARIKAEMLKEGVLTSPLKIHDLRRTFASYLLEASGDIRLVQQSLGHSSVSVTERYAHSFDTTLASAPELASDLMFPPSPSNSK